MNADAVFRPYVIAIFVVMMMIAVQLDPLDCWHGSVIHIAPTSSAPDDSCPVAGARGSRLQSEP